SVETQRERASMSIARGGTLNMGRPETRAGGLFADRPRACVLGVEDDDVIRQLVTQTLQGEGYEVWQASHGQAARQLAERALPDVVLLDMRMPVMDGWEF